MNGWMDGCIYVCISVCMYVSMYLCMYGRSASTLIFSGGMGVMKTERYLARKMRPLLPNVMLRNSSICAMKSVPGRTTENTGCHEDC